MKQNFNTRIKKGLFPEMPQSFSDGLQRAAAACGSQDTRTESTPATGSEPKQRRFPIGKVLAGAAAAVLVAACVVIAAFIPGIGRSSHGATVPVVDPLPGKWALIEVEQNGETVDPEKIGLQMKLAFSDDGSVTVTTITGGAEGQYEYRYTFADNAIELTADDGAIPVLPANGTYDPETDTLRFVGADGDGALRFTREPDLVGKWTLTRIGELDPATFGVQYAEWMEFSADGTVTVIELFNSDTNEETFAYTVYGKTVHIYTEGKETPEKMLLPEQLVYDRVTDTLRCSTYKPDSGSQGELILSRTPNAIVWHSLVGKWTLTEIELYGSTGSPETSGLEMYLEFSDKESVTVTKVKETGTEQQTYQWSFISGNEIMLTEKEYITSSYYTILYDAATDTLRMDPDGYGLKGMLIFSRTPDEVIPETHVKPSVVGKWHHTTGLDAGIDITIHADGTASVVGWRSNVELPFIYTIEDGVLQFTCVSEMTQRSFTARYDEENDVLTVTMDGSTEEWKRTIPDLAGSFWTLTGMKRISVNGIDAGGDLSEPELIGPEMYLEFDADGTVTVTVLYGDETVRRTFRSIANGTSIDIPDADETVITDTLEYDAATDTLRMYYVSYSGLQADMIFSRTPDAVIPAGERKEITELRKQYSEYFGIDTSKGLKVYVWQMAESDCSCALLSGTDERSELEIGLQSKSTTIEQMRLILSTYGLEEKDIDVVPFHNPISSYWYEIDNDYKVRIRRLVKENMPFTNEELAGLASPPFSIADVVYDVDGDGQLETCSLNQGPTSGLFTVVFTVYRNGTLAYRNTFHMDYGELTFNRSDNGLIIQHIIPWNDGVQLHTEYRISIENGMIVLTDEIRGGTVEYWGLDDPQWNMKGGA